MNIISTLRQTSTSHPIFCCKDFLDMQDRVSYSYPNNKEVLINEEVVPRIVCCVRDHGRRPRHMVLRPLSRSAP
jgi:hypothetical protein